MGWLPDNKTAIQQWVASKAAHAYRHYTGTLDAVIQDFQEAVNSDPHLARYADEMFAQVPNEYRMPYNETPSGTPGLRNFGDLLVLLDHVIREGPGWYDRDEPRTAMDVVGFPINAALDWPMGTIAGHAFFLSPVVNEHIGRILGKPILLRRTLLKCLTGGFRKTPAS